MSEERSQRTSSDKTISRKDFLKKVAKAGGLAAVPLILDQFPVQAQPATSQRYTNPGGVGPQRFM